MSEAVVELQWNQTSLIACILANANRDPKKSSPFTLSDFHPLLEVKRSDVIEDSKAGFKQMKKLFCKKAKVEKTEKLISVKE